VGGALLVANQDVLQLRKLVEVLVDRQVGAAWVAEDVLDTFALQRFQHHLGSGHFFSFENEEAPTSRSGAFAIYLVVRLGRARPRSKDANKAQEAQKRYEGAGE
jgi:hypothetical protein